jgi:hypothetical protein
MNAPSKHVMGREDTGSDFVIALSIDHNVACGGFAPRQPCRW